MEIDLTLLQYAIWPWVIPLLKAVGTGVASGAVAGLSKGVEKGVEGRTSQALLGAPKEDRSYLAGQGSGYLQYQAGEQAGSMQTSSQGQQNAMQSSSQQFQAGENDKNRKVQMTGQLLQQSHEMRMQNMYLAGINGQQDTGQRTIYGDAANLIQDTAGYFGAPPRDKIATRNPNYRYERGTGL